LDSKFTDVGQAVDAVHCDGNRIPTDSKTQVLTALFKSNFLLISL